MKLLISSLQVSQSGSKGHLHPAIELALEAQCRGWQVAMLPVPGTFGPQDQRQLDRAGIDWIKPPLLPEGVLKSRSSLAELTQNSQTNHLAYQSFLIDPLKYQFNGLIELLTQFNPDAVLYDLLVYGVPLAAQVAGIPAFGYCAGLKLLAQDRLLQSYRQVQNRITNSMQQFLTLNGLTANFHYLEMLSASGNYVFAPEALSSHPTANFPLTLAGPLPVSDNRGDCHTDLCELNNQFEIKGHPVVVSFGSVLDPYDYPDICEIIFTVAQRYQRQILISSPQFAHNKKLLPNHVVAMEYLPLPALLPQTSVFIHHGGANSFSEALYFGVPQILIPLTNDQPIQGELLNNSKAGFSIAPADFSRQWLEHCLACIFDPTDPVHNNIDRLKWLYQQGDGPATVLNDITLCLQNADSKSCSEERGA
ncbi:glycosyltransferase [Microbulbifer epialgicus]|uniref:Glycosyltransferase n=1 Tax=Microbulbifer epialgicus TaxID=393907 RepID=A0ABV4P1P4_9GAMM